MRRALAVGTTAAAVALAGCNGAGYTSAVEDNFMEGCTSNKQVTRAYCQCLYDRIKKNLSYEEFKGLEDSIGTKQKAPAGTRKEFNAAVRACRSRL